MRRQSWHCGRKKRGDSAEFIKTALEKFAGAENIYVAEEMTR